ncbi:uncharacterized protein A4U43_C01F12450 [Asparagus officinalis]|uniref:FAS1 domain-containing protein n=1 Tax=Asparagus officinalis TaxID=4686 RepID=A0A5P1FRC1_ASPOF|nr:uncharacterized protein A4U43_C01F12450 [Asparagus officinalis]
MFFLLRLVLPLVHAPVYVTAAVALIIAAISTSGELRHQEETDVLLALHASGFHLTGRRPPRAPIHALTAVPVHPLRPPDEALSSLSPAAATTPPPPRLPPSYPPPSLLACHVAPPSHPPPLPNLTLTSQTSINGVPVTRPNLFVSGPTPSTASPPFSRVSPLPPTEPNWDRAVRALGSKGYVPFAIGLNAILDSLKESSPEQVTVFAPRDSGFDYVTCEAYLLEGAVRRHVAVGRFLYGELMGMGTGEGVRTVAGTVGCL